MSDAQFNELKQMLNSMDDELYELPKEIQDEFFDILYGVKEVEI